MNRRITWSDLIAVAAAFPLVDWIGVHGGSFFTVLGGLLIAQALLLAPVTLIHDLGHAVAAAALTPQRVTVEVGRGGLGFSLGRVDAQLGLDGSRSRLGLLVETIPRERLALIAAAGPLASGLFVYPLAHAAAASVDASPLLAVVLAAAAIQAALGVLGLIPMRGPTDLPGAELVPTLTDGMVLARALGGWSGAEIWWGDDDPELLALNAFSPDAREVIEGARSRGGGTVELLRGLAGPNGGFARRMLRERGIEPDFTASPAGRPESHAALARVIRRASEAVIARGGEYVATEDLLHELLADARSRAVRELERRGIDRREFMRDVAAHAVRAPAAI